MLRKGLKMASLMPASNGSLQINKIPAFVPSSLHLTVSAARGRHLPDVKSEVQALPGIFSSQQVLFPVHQCLDSHGVGLLLSSGPPV